MSKFDRIYTFIQVVEENGFAAAARKLQVSTAAVSRQMTQLEDELGAQLLTRSTRKLALTPTGEAYYQQCKKTFTELTDAETAIHASKTQATGVLHIMAGRYFAITYLLPRLAEFMEQNPRLQIEFILAERIPELNKEGIDILFGVSADGIGDLVRRRIATTRYRLCASPQYLKKYGVPEVPADLLKHRYITHLNRKPNNVIHFKDGKDIYLEPFLALNDSYAMRECAIRDMGLVNLHHCMVRDAIAEGTLIEVLGDYQETETNIYLYYEKKRYLEQKIRRFIDFYVEG